VGLDDVDLADVDFGAVDLVDAVLDGAGFAVAASSDAGLVDAASVATSASEAGALVAGASVVDPAAACSSTANKANPG